MGPYSIEDIQKLYDEEKLLSTDVVWKIGLKGWIPFSKLINQGTETNFSVAEKVEAPIEQGKSINKTLILISIFLMALTAYFLLNRSGPKLPYSHLKTKDFRRLEKLLLSGKELRELILSKDAREIWLAINISGPFIAKLSLKSQKGKVLGEEEVVLNSKSDILDGWARFYAFNFEKGNKILPGYYNYMITIVPSAQPKGINYLLSKLGFLWGGTKLPEVLRGSFLFSSDSASLFKTKLLEYRRKIIARVLQPIYEKLEKWQAYLSILNKTEILLQEEVKKISLGSDISSFENKFTEFLGPMLSQVVLESKKLSTLSKDNLEYEKLFLMGKDIGEGISHLVLQIKKIKKIVPKNRQMILDDILNVIGILQKNTETEISKIHKELDLMRNS